MAQQIRLWRAAKVLLTYGKHWYIFTVFKWMESGCGCVIISSWPCGREQWEVCGWEWWLQCVWSVWSGAPPSLAGPAGGCTPPGDGQTLGLQRQRWCCWRHLVNECHSESLITHVALPLSSKAFLWASQSSSLVTVMLARGNFPWRGKSSHQNQHITEKLLLKWHCVFLEKIFKVRNVIVGYWRNNT